LRNHVDDHGIAGDRIQSLLEVPKDDCVVVIARGSAEAQGEPFAVISGSPFNVPASQSTNVIVRFAPATAGAFTTNVIFTTNGGSSTNAVTGTVHVLLAGLTML